MMYHSQCRQDYHYQPNKDYMLKTVKSFKLHGLKKKKKHNEQSIQYPTHFHININSVNQPAFLPNYKSI